MRYTKVITSFVLAGVVLTQSAFAQGYPGYDGPYGRYEGYYGHRHGPHPDDYRPMMGPGPGPDFGPRGPGPGPRPGPGFGPEWGGPHPPPPPPPPPPPGFDRGPGAGPYHNIYRGGYLPRYYRDRVYVVERWREYDLAPPPRGYHWVQVGGDYVLAAIATGLIMQILLDH